MRIMGIDYGDSRVGVAVSDLLCITAQGVATVKHRGMEHLIEDILELIKEYKPDRIVLGLPKNMDGSSGFRAEATYEFKAELEKVYDGEIVLWDERLTTVVAHNILNETNTRGKKRKKVVDTVAAALILENYLNANQGKFKI